MTPPWLDDPAMPPAIADMLLAGTVGRDHLLRVAAMAGETAARVPADARPDWHRRQALLLSAALEEDSLFGPAAGRLLTAVKDQPEAGGVVSPAFAALLEDFAGRFSVPENTSYYQRLVAGGVEKRLDDYLENECRTGRHSLFWLHVALRRAVLRQNFAWALACLQKAMPRSLEPLRAKLSGDLALLAGQPEQALACYKASQAAAPWPAGLARLGMAARQCGDTRTAMANFTAALAAMPEHATAALALYDLAFGRNQGRAPLPDNLAIALYTYNKAVDLDLTLASLFATDIGQARTVVLDNASTDDTPAVIAAWTDRVGAARLRGIRLPVNIGAPAARNWLAADPDIGQADHVAYLDDDVDLPPDWLGRLAAAAVCYPEAGVWGCHVADAANPAIAQGIDAMLLPPSPDAPGTPQPRLGDAHAQGFDYGAFAHMRPCLTVMGCCHLFRRERLLAAGGFDIRYSPSQYDDVDHDLRLVLAGRPPVYQGHLTVRHRRPAPVLCPPRPDQLAGGQANYAKLMAKHAAHFDELAATLRTAVGGDLSQKWMEMETRGLIASKT